MVKASYVNCGADVFADAGGPGTSADPHHALKPNLEVFWL